MNSFLKRVQALSAEEIAMIGQFQAAAQRTARDASYRQAREKVSRLDVEANEVARVEEAFLAAVRDSGYTGEKVRAQSAVRWAGLAAAYRGELTDEEARALSSAWLSALTVRAS